MRGVAPPPYATVGGTRYRGSPPSYATVGGTRYSEVAPLISLDGAALPMKPDRQGRAPRGPYFFFFLVAFFFATVSPPSAGTIEWRICSAC